MTSKRNRVWTEERKKKAAKQAVKNKRRGSQNAVRAAQMMNAINTGASGGEDGVNNTFSLEFKSREKSVAHGFMEQAVNNKSRGKIPIVVIHKNKDFRDNDLICIRFQDWHKICKSEYYEEPKKRRVKADERACHV